MLWTWTALPSHKGSPSIWLSAQAASRSLRMLGSLTLQGMRRTFLPVRYLLMNFVHLLPVPLHMIRRHEPGLLKHLLVVVAVVELVEVAPTAVAESVVAAAAPGVVVATVAHHLRGVVAQIAGGVRLLRVAHAGPRPAAAPADEAPCVRGGCTGRR
mmetsp:Transcript_57169/g.149738  ORF Transcript_57169/g.149738 Transcript_57169/m.149738 type:complete len:156 (+) Transcript_57169:666-1133(+)